MKLYDCTTASSPRRADLSRRERNAASRRPGLSMNWTLAL